MTPQLGETIYVDFITSTAAGAAVDADSTPTCEVFENATDTAILSPTVTKRTSKTGNYRVPIACTTGNGFEEGKSYNVVASATVSGVAAKAVVRSFQIRTASAVGAGASENTLIVETTTLVPIADADVWISTDSAGTNVVAGTKQTNSSGEVTFYLDAGEVYYMWCQKDGVDFNPNPQQFTAT